MEYSLAILKLIYLTIGRLEYECPQMVLLKYQLKKNSADRLFPDFCVLFFEFFVQIPPNIAPRHSIGSTEDKPLRHNNSYPGESSLRLTLATSVQKNFETT